MNKNVLFYVNLSINAINEKKGINVLALDVQGLSSVTDYLIIAEGSAEKHVMSLAQHIKDTLKKEGLHCTYEEGFSSGDWIVLDYPGFMIHLFMPGLREHYELEKIWPESKLLDQVH